MHAEPTDSELEAVLRLAPADRYEHFLKRVVDFDQVWMIEDDAGLVTFNHGDDEVLPVWPARRYAEHAMEQALRDWTGARYLSRPVREWLGVTLKPLSEEAGLAVAVFADAHGEGFSVSIPDIVADLEDELGRRLDSLPGFDPDAEEVNLDEVLRPAMRASMKSKPKGRLP